MYQSVITVSLLCVSLQKLVVCFKPCIHMTLLGTHRTTWPSISPLWVPIFKKFQAVFQIMSSSEFCVCIQLLICSFPWCVLFFYSSNWTAVQHYYLVCVSSSLKIYTVGVRPVLQLWPLEQKQGSFKRGWKLSGSMLWHFVLLQAYQQGGRAGMW